MKITPQPPLQSAAAILETLRSVRPDYSYELVENRFIQGVIVGDGKVSGVQANLKDGTISLGWQMPDKVVRMLLPLSIVLSGLLPGLLLFLIVWLINRGRIESIKADIAFILSGGAQGLPSAAATPALNQGSFPAPGGFGAPAQAPAAGGFGAPTQAPAAGGFGAPAQPQGAGGFGAPVQAPAAGGFGAPAQPQGAGGFGAPAQPQGAGGFGAQAPAAGGFGAPAQAPAAPPAEPAPGCAITVAGPDGTPYPAKFVRKQDGHVLCAFQNGQEQWYEERLVTFG